MLDYPRYSDPPVLVYRRVFYHFTIEKQKSVVKFVCAIAFCNFVLQAYMVTAVYMSYTPKGLRLLLNSVVDMIAPVSAASE